MNCKHKLTPGQADLYKAMEHGVVVHFMGGFANYYFRGDTMQNCTKQATGLFNKGWAIKINQKWSGHELAITPPQGKI